MKHERDSRNPWKIEKVIKSLDAILQLDFTGKHPLVFNRAPAHPTDGGNYSLTTLELDPVNKTATFICGPLSLRIENIKRLIPSKESVN